MPWSQGQALRLEGVTDALIAALAAGTGRPWGDGVAPGPQNAPPPYPYGLVYAIPGGTTEGDAGHPDSIATQVFQLTAVGRVRWEAENLGMRARGVILDRDGSGWAWPIDAYIVNVTGTGPVNRTLSVSDGLAVWARRLDSTGGHFREGAVSNWVDRFVLSISPA